MTETTLVMLTEMSLLLMIWSSSILGSSLVIAGTTLWLALATMTCEGLALVASTWLLIVASSSFHASEICMITKIAFKNNIINY